MLAAPRGRFKRYNGMEIEPDGLCPWRPVPGRLHAPRFTLRPLLERSPSQRERLRLGRGMYSQTPPYREKLEELTEILRSQGSLGLLLIDATDLAHVERHYGSKAFDKVLSMATELVVELRGIEVRNADLLALNDRGGNAFLVFLSPKRAERDGRTRVADLQ